MADLQHGFDLPIWHEGVVVPFPVDRVRPPLGPQRVEWFLRAERQLTARRSARVGGEQSRAD